MIELARTDGTDAVQIRQMSEVHDIPQAFLLQVMQHLRRSGLVTSVRGPTGGYRLARKAETITLAEIIDVFEDDPTVERSDPTLSGARRAIADASERAEVAKRQAMCDQRLDAICRRAYPEAPTWSI